MRGWQQMERKGKEIELWTVIRCHIIDSSCHNELVTSFSVAAKIFAVAYLKILGQEDNQRWENKQKRDKTVGNCSGYLNRGSCCLFSISLFLSSLACPGVDSRWRSHVLAACNWANGCRRCLGDHNTTSPSVRSGDMTKHGQEREIVCALK